MPISFTKKLLSWLTLTLTWRSKEKYNNLLFRLDASQECFFILLFFLLFLIIFILRCRSKSCLIVLFSHSLTLNSPLKLTGYLSRRTGRQTWVSPSFGKKRKMPYDDYFATPRLSWLLITLLNLKRRSKRRREKEQEEVKATFWSPQSTKLLRKCTISVARDGIKGRERGGEMWKRRIMWKRKRQKLINFARILWMKEIIEAAGLVVITEWDAGYLQENKKKEKRDNLCLFPHFVDG